MALVRKDARGLYVISGGVTARPGAIRGYGHAYRMDDGGLAAGDKVDARHIGGTPMVRLKLPNGQITRWYCQDSQRDDEIMTPDPDAVWDAKGLRIFPDKHGIGAPLPRKIKALNGADLIRQLTS